MAVWTTKQINAKDERNLLIGLIVSDAFIKKMYPILKPELLTKHGRILAKWCLEYYKEYEKAPGIEIQDIYERREKEIDEDTSKIVKATLESLSDQPMEELKKDDKFNTNYIYDKTEQYLNARALKKLTQDITSDISNDRITEATLLVNSYNKIQRPNTAAISLLVDKDWVGSLFDNIDNKRNLFKLPGVLGNIIQPFGRDQLVAFAGPRKRGKTFWLMEVAMRAITRKLNTVFYTLEMSDEQIGLRMIQWLTGLPIESEPFIKPVIDCAKNQTGECNLKRRICDVELLEEDVKPITIKKANEAYIPCTICRKSKSDKDYEPATWIVEESEKKILTKEDAVQKLNAVKNQVGNRLRIMAHPSDTINTRDIENELDIMEMENGFIPDVIVVDYADLMAPEERKLDYRHRLDATWKNLKRLAQSRHCLVVTATQTNKQTLKRKVEEGDSSEDSRKEAHVDTMIGLNQSVEDKEARVMKLGLTAKRHGHYNTKVMVTVLHCFDIGRPYLDSYMYYEN